MSTHWTGYTSLNRGILHYIGPAGDNEFHAHAALQIVTVGDCEIFFGERHKQSAPLYVRPMAKHRLVANSIIEIYLIEPSSALGQTLLSQLPGQSVGAFDLVMTDFIREQSTSIAKTLPIALVRAITELSGPDAMQMKIEIVAKSAGMSVSRLRALAQRELGVSLSRWRLWQALQTALEELAAGSSPADAACAAGFSDQAHLTRRMKATLGLTPGQVLPRTASLKDRRSVQDQ